MEKQTKKENLFLRTPPNQQIRELLDTKAVSENVSVAELKTKLAKICNVTSEAIRLWTTGYARPDISKLRDIANFFGVTTDYLLGDTESRSIDPQTIAICDNYGLTDISIERLKILTKSQNALYDLVTDFSCIPKPKAKAILKVINVLLENIKYLGYNSNPVLEMLGEFLGFNHEKDAFFELTQTLLKADDNDILQIKMLMLQKALYELRDKISE